MGGANTEEPGFSSPPPRPRTSSPLRLWGNRKRRRRWGGGAAAYAGPRGRCFTAEMGWGRSQRACLRVSAKAHLVFPAGLRPPPGESLDLCLLPFPFSDGRGPGAGGRVWETIPGPRTFPVPRRVGSPCRRATWAGGGGQPGWLGGTGAGGRGGAGCGVWARVVGSERRDRAAA